MCSMQIKEQNTATKNLNGNAAEGSQKKQKKVDVTVQCELLPLFSTMYNGDKKGEV